MLRRAPCYSVGEAAKNILDMDDDDVHVEPSSGVGLMRRKVAVGH